MFSNELVANDRPKWRRMSSKAYPVFPEFNLAVVVGQIYGPNSFSFVDFDWVKTWYNYVAGAT